MQTTPKVKQLQTGSTAMGGPPAAEQQATSRERNDTKALEIL